MLGRLPVPETRLVRCAGEAGESAKDVVRPGEAEQNVPTVPEQAEPDHFAESIRKRLHSLDDEYDLTSVAKRAQEAAASAEESASRA
ncbi:UNVERIFIED_ORG: hypothetical protein ABIB52_000045 [Arthrobacter sp. UYCu721]